MSVVAIRQLLLQTDWDDGNYSDDSARVTNAIKPKIQPAIGLSFIVIVNSSNYG